MNVKIFKIKYWLILSIIVLSSCNGDDDSFIGAKKHLPERIILDGEISTTAVNYKYDQNNRLINVLKTENYVTDGKEYSVSFDISYNSVNNISNVIRTTTSSEDKNYVDIDTIGFIYEGTNVYAGDTRFEINTEGQLLSINIIDNGTEVNQSLCSYDSYGNLNRYVLKDETGTIVTDLTYEYDDKKGIFGDVNTPQWFFLAFLEEGFNFANNNIEQVSNVRDGSLKDITRNYKYNVEGYPVSEWIYLSEYSLTVDVEPLKIIYKVVN
ncbi:hypothetical protein D0T53_09090 [Dysgonomonas sp. 216]|uniref:hypothetical protein n=1 Tax=Dysgonomonas sp. 216 TaxID=2302934 RepID=UPI0013D7F50D|nr:hypothetical protein [Dysgonomonas sp. 216]NDW19066.1 hypothetical protein [Dysgonomonas sp. 216]